MDQTANKPQLPTFFSLVRESLRLYRAKWQTLLKIALVQSAFGFLVAVIIGSGFIAMGLSMPTVGIAAPRFTPAGPTGIVIIILTVIGAIFFNSWMSAATIAVLRDRQENYGFGEAAKRARKYILSFAWVSLLASLAAFAGFIFFIIPGIIFSVWFLFSGYIVVTENERGTIAISKSREYARGYFWSIFLLYLLLMFSLLFIDSFLGIFGASSFGQFVRAAGSIILAPLPPIYYFSLLDHLRKAKEGALPILAAPQKNILPALATFGLILLIISIGLLIFYAPQINDLLKAGIQKYPTQINIQPPVIPPGSI